MKKICTLLLTAGMLIGAATGASAIDFKAKGQWIFGFGAVDTMWGGQDGTDTFNAQQRVRLQIDAVASESLSGTVFFEIGDQVWGNGADGAALGTDGVVVEVKRAYIDWFVPNTELSFRMGLQGIALPSVAGGSAILDDDAAAIVANYKFNDMVSLTAAWARPYNDNYDGSNLTGRTGEGNSNFLDNMDLFLLSLPIKGENWSVNPWFMIGAYGDNLDNSIVHSNTGNTSGMAISGMFPTAGRFGAAAFAGGSNPSGGPGSAWHDNSDPYTVMWFAGIPMSYQMDAWNFELDFNYGSVGYSGTYTAQHVSNNALLAERVDAQRSGWLIKGLVEYKMDWGTPGLFAWYGSGDDGNISNGSEMMPFLSPCGNFTSFMGDGNELGWQPGTGYDNMLSYSGTWGIGLQLAQMSFVEDLSHTFRVAYWRGTNHADNADYLRNPVAAGTMYLTENDYLVEFNLDSTYQIYENLQAVVQFGYIINGFDSGTWADDLDRDAYKATLTFNYSF